MISTTAYEAFYQYIGLELQSRLSQLVLSPGILLAALLMIFALAFFKTVIGIGSRYVPGSLMQRRHVPFSALIKLLMCLSLAFMMLKPSSQMGVNRANGDSWHASPYFHHLKVNYDQSYKVSWIYSLMTSIADEISVLLTKVIEVSFKDHNSQLDSPNAFYKAILYAGASTIEDPNLKRHIKYYTDECFERVLPLMKGNNRIDDLYNAKGRAVDEKLSQIVLEKGNRNSPDYTCLDVKQELTMQLRQYAGMKPANKAALGKNYSEVQMDNYLMSSLLLNQYKDNQAGALGLNKTAVLPTTGGKIMQYLDRATSMSGISSLFGADGLNLAVTKAQDFNALLSRAPHFAGMIKIGLSVMFVVAAFFVIGGYWKILIYWWALYLSVSLWNPIWALIYHIMLWITESTGVMKNFGALSDGISLYSAELISSQVYHMLSACSAIQIGSGCMLTGFLIPKLSGIIMDTTKESAPEAVGTAVQTVNVAAKVASLV